MYPNQPKEKYVDPKPAKIIDKDDPFYDDTKVPYNNTEDVLDNYVGGSKLVKAVVPTSTPALCLPENYTIVQHVKFFKVKLPGGIVAANRFQTVEEAQKYINKLASFRMDSWLESEGKSY